MSEDEKNKKILDMLFLDIVISKEIISDIFKKNEEDFSGFAINNRIREFKGKILNKSSVNEIKRIAKSKEKIIRKQIDKYSR